MCVSIDIEKSNLRSDVGNSDPRKYNGGQLYIDPKFGGKSTGKYCINVDWLTLTLRNKIDVDGGEQYTFDDSIVLVRENRNLSNFKYFYNVYLHGEHFGELCTSVRDGSFMNDELSTFRVLNHILYQKNWVVRLEYIIDKMGCKVNNVTRLDVAVDGGNFIADFQETMQGEWERVGRAKHKLVGGAKSRFCEGFYIGTGSSEKQITGYNKSKEIRDKHKQGAPMKKYIIDMWAANGLDLTQDIERLEIKLKSKAFKRLKEFDWTKLESTQYMAGVMKSFFKRFYEFTERSNDSNVTRKEKIQAVDWSYFDSVEIERVPKVKKPNAVWGAMRAITFCMMEQFADITADVQADFFSESDRCRRMAERYNIVDWFQRKVPDWMTAYDYHEVLRDAIKSTRKERQNVAVPAAMFTNA